MIVHKEQEYRRYLTISSKDAYIAGIKKIADLFEKDFPEVPFFNYVRTATILSAGDFSLLSNTLRPIECWLQKKRDLASDATARKSYSNFLSYLRRYLEFLCNDTVNSEKEVSHTGKVRNKSVYLLWDYKKWLEEVAELSPKSIDAYLTTLRSPKAISWVGKDMSFRFSTATGVSYANTLDIIQEVEELIAVITERLTETRDSSLSDQRSHLRKYVDFLSDYSKQLMEVQGADIHEDEEEPIQTPSTKDVLIALPRGYEKEDIQGGIEREIQNIFSKRLRTQDRATKQEGAVYYPIRIIAKLFATSSEYKKIFAQKIKEQIETIEVVVDEAGHTILLRDVDKISILPNKEVYVYSKGKKLRIYTSDAKSTRFYPMEATEFRNIHIDHKTTISSILTKLGQEGKLPKLRQLTDVLRGLEASCGGNVRADELSEKFFEDESKKNAFIPFLSELMAEVEMIQKATGLQLMSRYENARKKKN